VATGRVPADRAAAALPAGFSPSDTAGFLGLSAAPGQATVALFGLSCGASETGDERFGPVAAVHFLVGVRQPAGVPLGREATGFYDLGVAAPESSFRDALSGLGFRVVNGTVQASTRELPAGRFGATLISEGPRGEGRAEGAGETGTFTRAALRLYSAGTHGLSFLSGNLTRGEGGLGTGTLQFGDASPLSTAATTRVASGPILAMTGASWADTRSFHDASWTPAG